MKTSPLVIGVLECGTNRDQWIGTHGNFADWFKPFLLQAADRLLEFKVFRAHLDDLPRSADEADVWLITGSPISVYDEPQWQTNLIGFLESSLHKPVIGICYGHQLLHYMMGGKVELMPQWGVGAHTYDVIERPLWLKDGDIPQQLTLLASHQDQVTELAPNTKLIASSGFCQNAVTQIGSTALTVQPHPELTKMLAREVYEFRREIQGEELTDQALTSIDELLSDKIVCQWIFSFVDHIFAQRNSKAMVS